MKESIMKQMSKRTISISVVIVMALVLTQQFVSADLKEKQVKAVAIQANFVKPGSTSVKKSQLKRHHLRTAVYNQFAISTRH